MSKGVRGRGRGRGRARGRARVRVRVRVGVTARDNPSPAHALGSPRAVSPHRYAATSPTASRLKGLRVRGRVRFRVGVRINPGIGVGSTCRQSMHQAARLKPTPPPPSLTCVC